jgi:hypothetical protein
MAVAEFARGDLLNSSLLPDALLGDGSASSGVLYNVNIDHFGKKLRSL